MKKTTIVLLMSAVYSSTVLAQFTGPSVAGSAVTVAQAKAALPGRYVTVAGHVVSHLREDYYNFRDASGEIRVEIESSVWQGRKVGPDTKVRLVAEVDLGVTGRYLWVKSLDVVESSAVAGPGLEPVPSRP